MVAASELFGAGSGAYYRFRSILGMRGHRLASSGWRNVTMRVEVPGRLLYTGRCRSSLIARDLPVIVPLERYMALESAGFADWTILEHAHPNCRDARSRVDAWLCELPRRRQS